MGEQVQLGDETWAAGKEAVVDVQGAPVRVDEWCRHFPRILPGRVPDRGVAVDDALATESAQQTLESLRVYEGTPVGECVYEKTSGRLSAPARTAEIDRQIGSIDSP